MNDQPTRDGVLNEIAAMIDLLVGDKLARMMAMALPGTWLTSVLDSAAPDWRDGTMRMQWLVMRLVQRAEEEGRIHELLDAVAAAFPESESTCDELKGRYWQTVDLHAPPLETMIDEPETATPDLHPPTTANGTTANGRGDDTTTDVPTEPVNGAPRIETLRLDTAVPARVVVGQAFKLAVAIKQLASPKLNRPDLPTVESGDVEVFWLPGQTFVRLRIEISAPDCTIEGNDSDTFRLVAGRDSPVFLYHLTPKRQGPISIFVTVYQEEDRLGTAGLNTTADAEAIPSRALGDAGGTVAGSAEVILQSQPLNRLFPAAEAIQPLYQLALELVADDTLTPLLIAEQAGLVRAKLAQVAVPADQWWIVLVAAHEAKCIAAICKAISDRYPNRATDLNSALDHYTTASAP